MAIEDYRNYKKKQSSSSTRSSRSSSTSRPRTSSSSKGRTSSANRSTTRKRPTGTVVKKRKRVKKYRLTKEGKEFFQKLGLYFGLGSIGVATLVGLINGGEIGRTKAETTNPPGLYGEDTRDKTAEDILNEITGGVGENETKDTYISSYGKQDYYFCSQEYALELADDAIDNVNEMFENAGMNPLVPGSENYLPEYFDKYMLAGLAFQESTFRYLEADGDPIYSSVMARGMCQCKEETLDYVKWYAKTVLGVELDYDFEDLDDPRVSMEVAAMVLATNAETHFKPTRKDNAFSKSGISFSPQAQKTMMLSSYYHGAQGVVNRLLKSGTTTSDYAKGILSNEAMLREKYGEMQR